MARKPRVRLSFDEGGGSALRELIGPMPREGIGPNPSAAGASPSSGAARAAPATGVRSGLGKAADAAKSFGGGKWGKRLLLGGGWLGTAWMAIELLGILKEAAKDKQGEATRRIGGETWAQDLMTAGSRTLEDELASSDRFAQRARNSREIKPGMSRELQSLIEGREKELSGMTQKVKPSIREAYARHGLIS